MSQIFAQPTTSIDLTAEERPADSPYVERVWRSHSAHGGSFVSIAQPQWGIVVTRIQGRTMLTVRGPETRPTPAFAPEDAEFFGIHFKPGTLMPQFPAQQLMDRCDVTLPEAAGQRFWLNSGTWPLPNFDNVETFVSRLVHDGLLMHDPVVADVLQGYTPEISLRSAQRRFLRATGLTHGALRQIERARYATILLKQGTSILDTVYQAGYADQPHLTRSLKAFTGQTPAQIAVASERQPLSFLFKTAPF